MLVWGNAQEHHGKLEWVTVKNHQLYVPNSGTNFEKNLRPIKYSEVKCWLEIIISLSDLAIEELLKNADDCLWWSKETQFRGDGNEI